MVQVIGFLPPAWKIRIEFLAPSFSLAWSGLAQPVFGPCVVHLGNEAVDGSVLLSFSN